MRKTTLGILTIAMTLGLVGLQAATVTVTGAENKSQLTPLERQIRKQLIMLPFYGVFDYFEFEVEGDRVTLKGNVSRPTLRPSAERVVESVAGVRTVENQIEVLPVSSFDNLIRRKLIRAVYGDSVLNRYGAGSNTWIRLIVRNGDVLLEGYVDRDADKNVAFIRANGVSGAFSVTSHLKVKTT